MKTRKVKVTLSKTQIKCLKRLVKTGLWGQDVEEAAERVIGRELFNLNGELNILEGKVKP